MYGLLFSMFYLAVFHWTSSLQTADKATNNTENLAVNKIIPLESNPILRAYNRFLTRFDIYANDTQDTRDEYRQVRKHPKTPDPTTLDLIRRKTTSLFTKFIVYLHGYVDLFIDLIFGLYYLFFNHLHVPKPKNPLVLESATSLARKIPERHITSEEVVHAFSQRIKEVNPIINAVTDSRFEDAIREAKEIDQNIASGQITEETFKQKPFLGVPFTTKETTACKGMKHTYGILPRANATAEEDADVIVLVKKAGGILLGTDIAGSIRIPSFMCGVFGHKTSSNLISNKGFMYRTGREGPTMATAGPIVKYAEDLIPFLKVLLGNNVHHLNLDENVNVKELRVYYTLHMWDPRISALGSEMRNIFLRTVDYFVENCKMPPKELDLPNIKYGGNLWRYWMTQEASVDLQKGLTDRRGKINPYLEIIKYFAVNSSKHTAGTIWNLINSALPGENEVWARNLTTELRNELVKILDNNGVLLYPSAPWSASYHNTALLRPWNFYYFAIWSALKMPVTQVPLGLDSKGLPVGIQVVCAPYQDYLCIAVAKELEKAFGGYVPPFA